MYAWWIHQGSAANPLTSCASALVRHLREPGRLLVGLALAFTRRRRG